MTNIIEVSFGGGSIAYVKVDTAYFYNNGIIFKPTDIDLPASYQVHWADSPQASSTLETIGTSEGAPIPDDLWDRSRVIYGWIYLHPTENSGVTAYEVRIYKNVRAGLPDGTEPTPAEQSTIDQLISALNGAVEQAEDAQEAIENMSVSATTLAEGESATVTKSEQDGVVHLEFGIPKGQTGDDGYSPTANVSKSGKTATITITDKNGTTSAQVEDGEDGIDGISPSVSVTDITGGHRVVITDKDGAKSFDVEDGATGATPNLTIGTVETLDPTDDATATITGTPENPVLNLGIPQGDAGEVTTEEFLKAFPTDTASGAIASFSDGADNLPLKSLVVDINPVQDLHGQDAPYPAGGGINLFNKETVTPNSILNGSGEVVKNTVYVHAVSDYIAVAPNTAYYFKDVRNSSSGYAVMWYDTDKAFISSATIWATSGDSASASVTVPSNARYVRVCVPNAYIDVCSVNYPSTDTSYHPYENICPISGWTSVDVEQRGVNFFGGEIVNMAYVVTTGGVFVRVNASYRGIYAKVKGGHTYTVSRKTIESSRFRICATVEEPANEVPAIDISSAVTNDSKYALTFTVPSGYNYVLVYLSNSAEECTPSNYQIEPGSTATPYEPYTGRSITIQLGQTVYGGKLDVLSGELVIDRTMVDLGTLNWSYQPPTTGIPHGYFTVENIGYKPTGALICSCYKTVTTGWTTDKVIRNHGSIDKIYVIDSRYTSIQSFVEGVTGQQLVYELATPITIQLTPNQVNSLLGVNNIWADSGNTEVEYRADTKLFIERLTAPDSADMVADANITSGQYFMVGNSLYKATANIANGSAIIVGTNCTRKSLSEALNEINA